MADMFYFCSPPAPVKYFGSSSSSSRRYRRPVGKSFLRSRAAKMERACMARFAEPVFCSTLFPVFTPQLDDEPGIYHGEQRFLPGGKDLVEEAIGMFSAPEDSSPLAVTSSSPGDTLEITATYDKYPSRQPPSQCDDAVQDSGPRPCIGLDGGATDSLPHFEMRSDPLARSRPVSQQPSCDSLRNFASVTEPLQAMTRLEAFDDEQAPLPDDIRTQYDVDGQYTVLTDTVESAWSVDDPRYGADVLDSLSWWTLSDTEAKIADVLAQRASADSSTLPAFSRQESLMSNVDCQGINWRDIGWSRQRSLQDRVKSQLPIPSLDAQAERHFRFQYYNGTKRPKFAHHQLRHVLASVDRGVYYTASSKVMRASLACPSVDDTVLDLAKSRGTRTPLRITCLTATDSAIIIAGGFDGEYALRNLNSSDAHSEGYVTHDRNGLVTHAHTFSHRRSGLPQAAFCANDQRLRLMDVATETFTKTLVYDHSLNNAVTAPDGRLRLLAGDSPDALIADAESGETLATLRAHNDHIFACAWSPTDRFLATGAQDGKVALWDPRNWSKPFAELSSALSCSRSLHFTRDGSKLISAENEDVVSVFDVAGSVTTTTTTTTMMMGRQDICFFGTIAGVALIDGGEELVVANGDRSVGGLLSFRRTEDLSVPNDGFGGSSDSDPVERCRRRAGMGRNRKRASVVEELVV